MGGHTQKQWISLVNTAIISAPSKAISSHPHHSHIVGLPHPHTLIRQKIHKGTKSPQYSLAMSAAI